MTSKRNPPRHLEAAEQAAFVSWARLQYECYPHLYPNLDLLHCSLNGMPMTKPQAVRAKKQGMIKGVPDLFLPYPHGFFCGLFLEMKQKDGQMSDSQTIMAGRLTALGYKVVTCYSYTEAIEAVKEYYGVQN